MTATDELRKLLDERSVEWMGTEYTEPTKGHPTNTSLDEPRNAVFIEYHDGNVLRLFDLTPAQAIEATLGRGTCRAVSMRERDKSPYLHDELVCSECGCQLAHEFGHVWQHYCPNCGRKVVEQ